MESQTQIQAVHRNGNLHVNLHGHFTPHRHPPGLPRNNVYLTGSKKLDISPDKAKEIVYEKKKNFGEFPDQGPGPRATLARQAGPVPDRCGDARDERAGPGGRGAH